MEIGNEVILFINMGIVLFYIIMFFIGYKHGFLMQVIELVGLLLAIYLAWLFSPVLASYFNIWPKEFTPLNDSFLGDAMYQYFNNIAWFVIGVIVLLVVLFLLKPILRLVQRIPVIKQINGLLGSIFSFFTSTVWIIIIGIILSLPFFKLGETIVEKSWIAVIRDKSSEIVKFIEEPLIKSKSFETFIDGIDDLNDADREELKKWFEENKFDEIGN